MSYRIVFNLYKEEIETGSKTLEYSTLLTTRLTATAVIDLLKVDEGFSVHVVEGIALSFVDFTCINVSIKYVVFRLKTIPSVSEKPQINLPGKCLIRSKSEINDEVLLRDKNELVYTYDRFECGASGFGETVLQWVAEHPIEMIFVGGWIWDRTKDIWVFLRNKLFKTVSIYDEDAPIIFSPKRFHKKLAKLMNIDPFYFQIIGISPVTRGKHVINVRTIKNEEYIVVAKVKGDIISIKKNESAKG